MKNDKLLDEHGFMGLTHAISVLAVLTSLMVWLPKFNMFNSVNIWVITLLLLVAVGGALLPDLDNTNSSAESALGVFGNPISTVMRAVAVMVQNLVHTRYDNRVDEAHRGFWHTTVAAIMVGGLLMLATLTAGRIVAIIVSFITIHVAISTLIRTIVKKRYNNKQPVKTMIFNLVSSVGISAITTFGLFTQIPSNMDYSKIGLFVGLGWLIHILGDTFTIQGTPLFWPIPIGGKCWWQLRLTTIEAGGIVENAIILPLFLILTILNLVELSHFLPFSIYGFLGSH